MVAYSSSTTPSTTTTKNPHPPDCDVGLRDSWGASRRMEAAAAEEEPCKAEVVVAEAGTDARSLAVAAVGEAWHRRKVVEVEVEEPKATYCDADRSLGVPGYEWEVKEDGGMAPSSARAQLCPSPFQRS